MVLYGYYDHCHLGHYCSRALGKILAQLSATLRNVVVRLVPTSHWSPFSLEESVDFPAIRRVFVEHAFSRLRAVTLQMQDWKPLEIRRHTLEKAFPELLKSGVLKIELVSAERCPKDRERTF